MPRPSTRAARRPARPRKHTDPVSVLAAVVESSDDAIIAKTLMGEITAWNAGAARMYGYTEAEALGRSIDILLPEDLPDDVDKILRQVKHGRPVRHYETRRRRKDGTVIDVSLTVSPIRRGGRVVGASTIARDVTERNRAAERFRLVFDAAPNGLLMVDADGRIVLANAQAEKLFGWTREELAGLTIEALIPRRFRAGHGGMRAAFMAAPATRAMGAGRDLFGLRKDGTEVPIEIGLNPIKEGDRYFVLASIIDITQRRALEKKLAHSETLASIGAMAAVMGHEIRNPLSSIVMAAGALARGGLEPQDLDSVMAVLVNESKRLHRTLEDFLQYSRPREPQRERADLNAMVRDVLAACAADRSLLGETSVKTHLDPKLPPFLFDQDQIRQVVWNIVRNGFQALGGSGRLEISTRREGAQVLILIQDDGPGIPPAELDQIFTPFFTTKTKGTGLGLPISRNIVRAHGGEIRVESEPRRGTRFTITLPVSGAAVPPHGRAA